MATDEINVARDWDFEVNLSGLIAPTGKGGNALPTGYYKVKLLDLYVNPERNANRVIIKVQVAEGPFTGTLRTTGFNKPTSNDDKVRYYWRGLAESAGYTPAQLDGGEIKLGLGTFQNRVAHIFFTAKDEENGIQYEDMDFLPLVEWTQQSQCYMSAGASEAAPAKAAAGSALGMTTPVIQDPTPLGSNNVAASSGGTAKSKLLSALGVN